MNEEKTNDNHLEKNDAKAMKILHIIFGIIFYGTFLSIIFLWMRGLNKQIPSVVELTCGISAIIYSITYKDKETRKKYEMPIFIMLILVGIAVCS